MLGSVDFESELKRLAEKSLGSTPSPLRDAILYSLLGPGKRIRPRLVFTVGRLLGLSLTPMLRAACAIEMIHCYTLIHDDLPCMDNDDLRRGWPTNHKVYGEATALLAGDALMGLAIDLLLENQDSVELPQVFESVKTLSYAMGGKGVIAGQVLEMKLAEAPSLERLETVFLLKTGALFEACVLIPASLSGLITDTASSAIQKTQALKTFANSLGMAFQIADDLEDTPGAEDRNPAHITYYLERSKAFHLAMEKLAAAKTALSGTFGNEKASNLFDLIHEIESKLKSTSTA